jgi:hypothetical protein
MSLTDTRIFLDKLKKDDAAHSLAREIAVSCMTDPEVSEARGPDRIVTQHAAFSVLVTRNGVELWIDVKAAP